MASTRQDVTISPRLVTALDRTWAAIQARHPDVPAVVIALGSGSGNGLRLKLGHFAVGPLAARGRAAARAVRRRRGPGEAVPATCSARCCTRPPTAWPACARSRTPAVRAGSTTPGTGRWPRSWAWPWPRQAPSAGATPRCRTRPRRCTAPSSAAWARRSLPTGAWSRAAEGAGRTTTTAWPLSAVAGRRVRVAESGARGGPDHVRAVRYRLRGG